jgi:hypothetical protein
MELDGNSSYQKGKIPVFLIHNTQLKHNQQFSQFLTQPRHVLHC